MDRTDRTDRIDRIDRIDIYIHFTNQLDINLIKPAPKKKVIEYEKDKDRYLDSVLLTKEEHKELVKYLGEKVTSDYIKKLNYHVCSTGKHYKSHFHTIMKWEIRDPKRPRDKIGGIDEKYFKER